MFKFILTFLLLSCHFLLAIQLFPFKDELIKVAIVGTNDIHGNALPTNIFRADHNETYNYGGLAFMASMINTIRQENPDNFLYLDAGDQFQGGVEASPLISQGDIINDYLNAASVDSSAIGNHEFDFGPEFLFNYWNHRNKASWNLAANVLSENKEEQFLPQQKNSWIFELKSGIKIGVIGLTTVETQTSTGAFNQGLFPHYKFLDYRQIVIRQSASLRGRGAHAVLILSHMGNKCNANNTFGIWLQNTQQESTCSENDQMSQLLKSIPTGTVDAVVQGHRHYFSHHFINGVPVIGTINGGFYFNVLYLYFYNGLIYEKVIEGPVPVCQKVFQKEKRCDYQPPQQLQTLGKLVQWDFHFKKVVAHPQIQKLFETKWISSMQSFLEVLAFNEVYLQRTDERESKLGNLVTDLVDMAFPDNDFVLLNQHGFRTIWYPGELQRRHFYNMFPFSNRVLSFQMTGKELIQTLEILQGGKKGFYPTKKLKQYVREFKNGTRTLINATFSDGCEIEPTRNYRGVSVDFLIQGGDDFKQVLEKVYTLRNEIWLGEFRDSLLPQLRSLGSITQAMVMDKENPRLSIEYV